MACGGSSGGSSSNASSPSSSSTSSSSSNSGNSSSSSSKEETSDPTSDTSSGTSEDSSIDTSGDASGEDSSGDSSGGDGGGDVTPDTDDPYAVTEEQYNEAIDLAFKNVSVNVNMSFYSAESTFQTNLIFEVLQDGGFCVYDVDGGFVLELCRYNETDDTYYTYKIQNGDWAHSNSFSKDNYKNQNNYYYSYVIGILDNYAKGFYPYLTYYPYSTFHEYYANLYDSTQIYAFSFENGLLSFFNISLLTEEYYLDADYSFSRYGTTEVYYSDIDSLSHIHDYAESVTDPTCTEKGYTTYSCECGETYIDDYVDALGHNYVDGYCSRCGEEKPLISEGLIYTLNADGTSYSCTGIGTCTDDILYIASTYNGLPVTSIGESAFAECNQFSVLNIPDSVKTIGKKPSRPPIPITERPSPKSIWVVESPPSKKAPSMAKSTSRPSIGAIV